MEYIELNNLNKGFMKNEMHNDLNFEWEDTQLLEDLLKKIDNVYPYSNDPQEFLDDKYFLNEINKLLNLLFERKINKELFIENLEKILKELLGKYPTMEYQYKYDIEKYKKIISKSNRLIIKGCGGIGKSYFIYKLEEKLSEYNIDHICVYGKYNIEIPIKVFEEIKNKRRDFYFIIDAINEFTEEEQKKILKNIEHLETNKNINIIVTYRTSSISKEIVAYLNRVLKNEYEFRGVDFESSLLKLIETYGIESVRYIDVIESNNPFYLKMLNEILFNSKLRNEEIGSLVQITFIMEKYIKDICGSDNWSIVKDIGKYMFENELNDISEERLRIIATNKYDEFIKKMVQNNFIGTYNYNGKLNFVFSIQKLSDYIIARPLFDLIKDKTEVEIISIVNSKLAKMYTLYDAFALVLFDKFKDNDIKKALRIIFKSDISKELEIKIFKKVSFDLDQINVIQRSLKYEDYKELFLSLGGFPNRPFNCKNYLNKILLKNSELQKNILVKYRESEYILHLKNILYTLPFITDEFDFLEEYFYYAFWLMAVPMERIRKLAIKVVYDITFKNDFFINYLMKSYYLIDEMYIKKGIIHVLTKLPKQEKIEKFINKIYLNKDEIDAEIIHRTSVYLNKEDDYQLLKKTNLNVVIPKKVEVDKKLDLKCIMFTSDIYEKYLLKFERYSSGNTISLYQNFIINDSEEINEYNKKILKKFDCIKYNGYCKYSIGNGIFKDHLEPIKITEISPERMFILYQEIFKELSKKYSYDYSKQEKFDDHINKFTNSLLKKILLLSQDVLLGSLMTNYYTNEFYVYNDDKTLGYKNYSYITYDEEKIYLSSPVSPYNELIDKLNDKLCERIELYKNNDYKWWKNSKISIDNCSKMIKPIQCENVNWSLIGGEVHLFIVDFINVSYSCYMAINPSEDLIGDVDSRYLTIENNRYYGNISDYINQDCSKNMLIPNFESDSLDIKNSNLSLPPPKLVKLLNLNYNFKRSSWDDNNGNVIIICDNNPKNYFKYPVSGAIYIRTDILNRIKKENNIVYWGYTEKLFKEYGWNENASLHIELDSNGNATKKFNNNNLISSKKEINIQCKKCQYDIFKEQEEISNNFNFRILDDLINDNDSK